MDDDILTDALLIEIAKPITGITAAQLSVHLGFGNAQGNNAQIMGFLQLNPQSAYESILHQFINKHGREKDVALKLRLIFRNKNMADSAKVIEKQLTKRGIPLPSHAEAAIDQSLNLPSPPHQEPETVRINQRGGAQTINASGNAQVTGNKMTGSSHKVIINNYASGASSKSREKGKKRKDTESKTKSTSGKKTKGGEKK